MLQIVCVFALFKWLPKHSFIMHMMFFYFLFNFTSQYLSLPCSSKFRLFYANYLIPYRSQPAKRNRPTRSSTRDHPTSIRHRGRLSTILLVNRTKSKNWATIHACDIIFGFYYVTACSHVFMQHFHTIGQINKCVLNHENSILGNLFWIQEV